jgi:hypothetical protein
MKPGSVPHIRFARISGHLNCLTTPADMSSFVGESREMRYTFRRPSRYTCTILLALAAVSVVSCYTLPAPQPGAHSSMILGELRLDAMGMGQAENDAQGSVNSDYTSNIAITIRNRTTGATYRATTIPPNGLFAVPNIEAGIYAITSFRYQVQTSNSYITVTTRYRKAPTFTVKADSIADIGTISWKYRYNLTADTRSVDIAFGDPQAGIVTAFRHVFPHSPWVTRGVAGSEVDSSGAAFTSTVHALQPRGTPRCNSLTTNNGCL